MNTTESSDDRIKRKLAEHRAAVGRDRVGGYHDSGMLGDVNGSAPVSAFEFLINRGTLTGDQLMALKVNLAGIIEKLEGNAPGENAEAGRDRRDGLLGFAIDQQDRIDALVSDCTGLVSRLSGLI